jgi:predicted acetyltransferase
MNSQDTRLILPTIELKRSYEQYITELGDEERYPYPLDLPYSDFEHLVHTLTQYSKGNELPDWMVTNSTFWLVENDNILACSHLRHTLNESLMAAGGHIGLGVRPSARGKGLGKKLLAQTLEQAKILEIKEVHIHCYESNTASCNLIKGFDAYLHSKEKMESGETLLRYIINN